MIDTSFRDFLTMRTARLRSMLSLVMEKVSLPMVFPWLVLLLVALSRLPVICFDGEIDVDQSLMMAQSMRYEHDLMPWRSVDTTTSGPLNSWAFYLMRVVFGPLSYGTVHAMAAVMVSVIILVTWLTLRALCDSRVAALGALTACIFVMLGQSPSMTHFTSETIPMLLLATSLLMISVGAKSPQVRMWAWPVAALLAGAAPWAKLQAAPLSAALGLGLFGMTWWLRPPGPKRSSAHVLLLMGLVTAAFFFTTAFFTALLYHQGIWEDFWTSYIARNLGYAEAPSANTQFSRILNLWKDISRLSIMSLLMAGLSLFAGAWVIASCPGWRRQARHWKAVFLLMLCYLVAGVYALTKPPFNFPHYCYFLFPSIALVSTMLLDLWSSAWEGGSRAFGRSLNPAYTCFLLTVFLMPIAGIKASGARWIETWNLQVEEEPGFNVSRRINSLAPQAASLGIWGWAPQIYVHSRLTPASRHAISHYLIDPHPLRERFRQNYLEDLKRERPEVFVDAVTPLAMLWKWAGKERIESFPELHDFLQTNYHLVEGYPHLDSPAPYRIYLLRESGN